MTIWMPCIAAMMLASCNQSDELLQTGTSFDAVRVTFNVQIPEMQTRATVPTDADETTVNRFICELYEGNDVTSTGTPTRIEQDNAQFSVLLKKNTDYVMLLWADNGTAADGTEDGNYYDASDLKKVRPSVGTTDKCDEIAFYACKSITTTSIDGIDDVTLNRAVAKVCLYETGLIQPGSSLTVEYTPAETFNVASGTTTVAAQTRKLTYELTDGVQSPVSSTGKEIARFYVLAPEKGKAERLDNLKFTLSEPDGNITKETPKSINNVPLQANYVTNIRGEFSDYTNKTFNVSLNETWGSETYEFVDIANFTTTDEYKAFFERQGKKGTLRITGNVTAANITLMGDALISDEYSYILDFSGANITEQLPQESFNDTYGIKGIILPEGLTEITNYYVFTQMRSLEFITLPTTLTTVIRPGLLMSCVKLVSVNMDKTGVTKIPNLTFASCQKLEKIALGNVTSIGSQAFQDCLKLKELDLSRCDQVPTLVGSAFELDDIPNLKVYVKSEDMIDEFVRVWSAKDSEFTKDNFIVKQ